MREHKKIMAFKFNSRMEEMIRKYAKMNNVPNTRIVEYALIEYFQKRNEDILF